MGVVWGHVAADVLINAPTSFQWWVGNITAGMVGWCMTIFIMASGYLLLNPAKQYTLTEFYKKRGTKILIPLAFWAIFYSGFTAIRQFSNGVPVTSSSFFTPILTGHPYYHLWYLYMLAGLYLLTPLLRIGVKKLPSRWLVIICTVLFVIPVAVNMYCWFSLRTNFLHSFPFITWPFYFLGFYVAGYLIGKQKRIRIGTEWLITAVFLSITVSVLGCYLLKEYYSRFLGEYFVSDLSPSNVLMALAFFMLVKKLAAPMAQNKFFEKGNSFAFGIYLIHPFYIFMITYVGLGPMKFNPVIGVPVVTAIVLGLTLLSVMVIKKIPYLHKVI
jgi:surface polysaccharide O-acyltransferase-like enzyme